MSDSEGSSGFSSAERTREEHVWALSQKLLLAENTANRNKHHVLDFLLAFVMIKVIEMTKLAN